MATRLRLQRHGSKGSPFYKIVAADARARRDGRYIDQLGTYNPTTIPATIILDVDKAVKWLQTGAEPTDTVKTILSYKGALYKKHLLRGVQLGVVKAEDVESKFESWLQNKEGKIVDHKSKADAVKKAKIDAAVKTPAKVKEVEVEETVEEPEVASEEVVAETETPTETEVTTETAVEEVKEAPVAEAEKTETTETKEETAE